MKLPIASSLPLISMLIVISMAACSPTDKAASEKPAFEIAKSERADLAKAKLIAAEVEKATAEAKQNIDEQTQ